LQKLHIFLYLAVISNDSEKSRVVCTISPNGLDFYNRNANGLRCAIVLHICLKGRTFALALVRRLRLPPYLRLLKIIAFQAKC